MGTEENRQIIMQAFDAKAPGTGGVLDLMAPEARWTIPGNSKVAGVYGRDEFLSDILGPFNDRLSAPAVSDVHALYADGDTVVAYFDQSATARDGAPYRNSYTWYLRLKDGAIVDVVAFFDSIAMDDLWTRVQPA
jgi:ketosteroid isomerase-like protein